MLSRQELYKKMRMIRSFEEMVLNLFSQNEISGTTHTCLGQEAIAVAAMENLLSEDIVFSNHRCHGHYLAYGGPADGLLAEIMSRKNGVCGGRGGSQHLHYQRFYSNGIQGGIVPNATGMAWAEKIKGTENIGIVFLGDGTLGQGIIYETMNMAALFEIPILYVIENNQYAMTTKTTDAVSGKIVDRPESFGIQTYYTGSFDVEELCDVFGEAKDFVRKYKKPACVVADTYRLGAHSKGDDTRTKDEIAQYKKKDPLELLKNKLSEEDIQKIDAGIRFDLESILYNVRKMDMAELPDKKRSGCKNRISSDSIINRREQRCVEQINFALADSMKSCNEIFLLGEDIREPYGGAFKVTKGLSSIYDQRIVNTPISEAGFTGIAVGMAMNGILPIVEIMFGDFVTLTFDQLLNHAVKYEWVYGNEVKVRLILRTPMGGGRGYGPTHSQSLEKHFLGIPGLEIMALSPVHDIYELYRYAIDMIEGPLQIIENKRMYSEPMLKMENGHIERFAVKTVYKEKYPTVYLSLDLNTMPDVIVILYGNLVREAMESAVDAMITDEIQVDIVVLSQVYPLPMKDLEDIVDDNKKILTVEEGSLDAGWGSEVIASIVTRYKNIVCERVAADNMPIANGICLEKKQNVGTKKILKAIRKVFYEN